MFKARMDLGSSLCLCSHVSVSSVSFLVSSWVTDSCSGSKDEQSGQRKPLEMTGRCALVCMWPVLDQRPVWDVYMPHDPDPTHEHTHGHSLTTPTHFLPITKTTPSCYLLEVIKLKLKARKKNYVAVQLSILINSNLYKPVSYKQAFLCVPDVAPESHTVKRFNS